MEIRAAGENRQRFVRGVTTQIRPQIQGVHRGLEKVQVCPMGVIHQQNRSPAVAHLSQGRNVRHTAQIIRTGDIDRRRRRRKRNQSLLQLPG